MTPILYVLVVTLLALASSAHAASQRAASSSDRFAVCGNSAELVPPMTTIQTETIDPTSYRIGSGDLLAVHWWGEYNATTVTVVSAEGEIYVPVLGELTVAGLTVTAVEAALQASTTHYYKHTKSGISVLVPHRREEVH
jgi:protein involved in polysaccharide export with SLBB domain